MMQIGGAKVVSFIPGRVRLKIDALQGDPELAGRVEKRLREVAAVTSVETKPETGSVLVKYNRREISKPENVDALCSRLTELFPDFDVERVRKWLT